MVEEGGREELAISFHPDMRTANVRFGQRIMSAKLYDLPCVSEVSLFFIFGDQRSLSRVTLKSNLSPVYLNSFT